MALIHRIHTAKLIRDWCFLWFYDCMMELYNVFFMIFARSFLFYISANALNRCAQHILSLCIFEWNWRVLICVWMTENVYHIQVTECHLKMVLSTCESWKVLWKNISISMLILSYSSSLQQQTRFAEFWYT